MVLTSKKTHTQVLNPQKAAPAYVIAPIICLNELDFTIPNLIRSETIWIDLLRSTKENAS